MSPLVSETGISPIQPGIISAEAPYISGASALQEVIIANDTEQTSNRSLLERRRKRSNRRAAH